MLKAEKLIHNQEQKVWFCSDWHAFHNPPWTIPIWKTRGFNSSFEMTHDIVNKTNAYVRAQDILVNLGDGFLNATEQLINSFLSQIACQRILYIWGNHENPLKRIYRDQVNQIFAFDDPQSGVAECYPLRYKNLEFRGDRLDLWINKKLIICSHFPYRIWEKSHHGALHLSGHSHYSDAQRQKDYNGIGKSLDISWDGKLAPYSFEEILDIMDKKDVKQFDHHNSETN